MYATAWSAFLVVENNGLVLECLVEAEASGTAGRIGALAVHNKEKGTFKNVVFKGKVSSEENPNNVGLFVTNAGKLENVFADETKVGTNNLLAHVITGDDGTHIITHEKFINSDTYTMFDKSIWNIVNGEEPKFLKE